MDNIFLQSNIKLL